MEKSGILRDARKELNSDGLIVECHDSKKPSTWTRTEA